MTLRNNEHYPNPVPKYLKSDKDGYAYVYSDKLFDKGGFSACDEIPDAQRRPDQRAEKKETGGPANPEDVAIEDTPEKSLLAKGLDVAKGILGSDEEKTLDQMNIDELLVYAKKNFGADIDPQAGEVAVRNEVIILQTAAAEGKENGAGTA